MNQPARLSLQVAILLLAWVGVAVQAMAACAPVQVLRDDVLVVVNDNSVSSPQVGDYYCEQRGIDPANVAHIRVPATNDVLLDQFISLRDQLIKHMQENTLPPGMTPVACDTAQGYTRYYCPESTEQLRQHSSIRYLVTTRGVPIRFKFSTTALPGNAEASVDNYLRHWLINYYPEKGVVFDNDTRAIAFEDGRGMRIVDPAVDAELIIGRIDGVDIESAMRLVDRAINAEKSGIYGKLFGNKFGSHAEESGPEGAYWKRWMPGNEVEAVYPSWRYLHGLFGEFNAPASNAVRHTLNPECLSYDANGKVPKECVTAVNRGGNPDEFPTGDSPAGSPWGRIPSPDNALVYQGHSDTGSVLHDFEHLLNWRDSDSCNTLCDKLDADCKAASTDAYKEIDTRCVRTAEGFIGYQYQSYPLGMMASWPTGWFQSPDTFPIFLITGSYHYYFWQPEVRDDTGFDDNYSLWYRNADSVPGGACYNGTEDYHSSPTAGCWLRKKVNINTAIEIPERAVNLENPQQITLRLKYRALGLSQDVPFTAQLMLRQPAYNDGVTVIPYSNQLNYPPVPLKTFTKPDDPADGTTWGDAEVVFTLDPALHTHPLYLYDGIKIRIETKTLFEGQLAIDNVTLEEDGVAIPMANPSFSEGHRELSGGDTAATFLSRLNGLAFWGNTTHHESVGHSFDAHPYETLIYFMRGLPLGDAVWFAEFHNAGILYGDPLYSPLAVHLHYLTGVDGLAPKDHFNTVADSPLALTGSALNGSGPGVTTTFSVDYCSGSDFLPCDQAGSWLPVPGLQDRPGGQRDMQLGEWDITGVAEGDYVLRLAVTSSNTVSGRSQTFYDYYPVTFYAPTSDIDADGLSYQEEETAGTNPWIDDTDEDGLPDGWEVNHGLDPLAGNANRDSDSDGHTDTVEYFRGTNPADSQSVPTVVTLEVDPVNGVNDGLSPFRTVAAAIQEAQAGDTVMLLAGQHNMLFVEFRKPLYLVGEPGQEVVLSTLLVGNMTPADVVFRDLSLSGSTINLNGAFRFERVTSDASIVVQHGASVQFINSLFTNVNGDALNIKTGSSVVVQNCTIAANTVGVRLDGTGDLQIINSIISGNTETDLAGVSPGAVAYSLTGNAGYSGVNGNIKGDPLFADAANGDFHLYPGSPAVDAGDPQSDFSQEPVSAVGRVNMGRYGNTPEAAVVESIDMSRADIGGTVKSEGGLDVCAMVLASGQYMFSCNPWGVFSLDNLPRESNGTIVLQVFADGFLPYKKILTGGGQTSVTMTGSGACPDYNAPSNPGQYPAEAGRWINISGSVAVGQDSAIPVCAMVLANGQHVFSCGGAGEYNFDTILDANGQVTIHVFADGFAPHKLVIDEFQTVNDILMTRASECS